MKASTLFRIAAILLLLFAAGHTFGFLSFRPATPEGEGVLNSMKTVPLTTSGPTFTYYGFYVGFGLFVTAYLLFAAFVAWHLASQARSAPHSIVMLSWGLFAVQVICLVLSWIWFSLPPAVFSAVVVVCVGWASWLVTTSPRPAPLP